MTLTIKRLSQLVATGGNGFGLFGRLLRLIDLPMIAGVCNHRAP
jgi:hypothetical protein